jgi:hypothetical protein
MMHPPTIHLQGTSRSWRSSRPGRGLIYRTSSRRWATILRTKEALGLGAAKNAAVARISVKLRRRAPRLMDTVGAARRTVSVRSPARCRRAPPGASGPPRRLSAVRRMTSGDGGRIVRGVSGERGTTPEYPDLRRQDMSRFVSAAPPPDLSQHDMDRIAGQRSREDNALQGHKTPSLWKRLFGRRGHLTP